MPPNKSKRSAEESPEERRSKRKKLTEEDEEEERERDSISKASSSKKTPVFSGGGSSHKPAELFRKDLISAMKLADSEPLSPEDYFLITDSWRQEWERGVQVPVNEVAIPQVDIKESEEKSKTQGDFKIPKKNLHASKDDTYQLGQHELTGMSQLAEQVVRYDLDDLDVCWLEQVNEMREEVGQPVVLEWTMERVIEALENNCHENMEIKKKTEEGLGIEYDEDIVCEICQSPDSEDTNEMVFCDGCDICVHQACYGIQTVPEGSWLCRTCALGIKPQCILCPKVGGAMKSTRSGTKWAHVSCAIWIPEVTIGCVEKMEPITKISQIPASRWSLVCVICKERCGACIQCSVKACKTAFHVTCAISEKLEMKTLLIEEKNSEDVKLKAYCPKHCKKRERNNSESEPDSPRKSCGTPVKEKMSEEEKATLRADRLRKLEEEFFTVVEIQEVAKQLELDIEVVDIIFNFWKLKRKSLFNRPLLTPKTEEEDLLEKQQEDSLVARMKMFVHLRQDLERVRNLSYMISKREKLKRQFARSRESVFYAVLEVLTDKSLSLNKREVDKIVKTYRDLPSPYDEFTANKVKLDKASKVEDDQDDNISEVSVPVSSVSVETKKIGKSSSIRRRKSIQETPKGRFSNKGSESPKSQYSGKDRSSVPPEESEKLLRIKQEPLEEGDKNNSSLDTSEILDVENDQDNTTLVNLLQSQVDTAKSDIKSSTAPKPAKRKRGRPSLASLAKRKETNLEIETKSSTESTVIKNSENETEVDKSDDRRKPVSRRRPTRSSLPGTLLNSDITASSLVESSAGVSDMEVTVKLERDLQEIPEKAKDRRQSAPHRLTEEEKQEIVRQFPSAKNVSDHIKSELHGYFKNNKLVVSSMLKEKVQNSLLSGRRRTRRSNGVIIDHAQSKIDSFFVKSPPHYGISEKSPAKNVSRVLNELSPTRDRFEANNVERTACVRGGGKLSDRSTDVRTVRNGYENGLYSARERLFDTASRGSRSRASTPDSCVGSVKSGCSSYRSDRLDRLRTRSRSPSALEDDTEIENLCDESRRVTRSHGESPSRHGSMSPRSVHRTQNVVT